MKPWISLAPFISRNLLGSFLETNHPKLKRGVEIGVHRGDFARSLLDTWSGTLIGVDPYITNYCPEDPISEQPDRSSDLESAREFERVCPRFRILLQTSKQAVQTFRPDSIDFIYLDGDHSYSGIDNDLVKWYSKIVPGGIISGHDFICPNEVNGGWGRFIQTAVFEFLNELPIRPTLHLIREDDGPWSFYFQKPE